MTIDRPSHQQVFIAVRRLFPRSARLIIEPVTAGVSTWVYRLQYNDETFYVRVMPEVDASLIPEAIVHDRLRSIGLRVPHVVAVEDRIAEFGHSIMVTTTIPGQPLSEITTGDHAIFASVLGDAGQELALLNQLPVDGYGWIRRDRPLSTDLVGEHASYRSWTEARLAEALSQLVGDVVTDNEAAIISNAVDAMSSARSHLTATLAHGDFDATHIYHAGGRYTGIIDFGEIRGADRWHDLAHFRLHDRVHFPVSTLRWLLDGYAMVTQLPDDIETRLTVDGLVNGLLALARSHRKTGRIRSAHQRFLLQAIRRDIDAIQRMF